MYNDDSYGSLLHDMGFGAGSGTWSEQHSSPDEGSASSFDMSGLDFNWILRLVFSRFHAFLMISSTFHQLHG